MIGRSRRWWPFAQPLEPARAPQQEEPLARSQAELQQAILTLAEAVRGSVARERSDAVALEELVERLRTAAARQPLEDLRRSVRRAAEHLLRLAAQREQRQQVLTECVTHLSNLSHPAQGRTADPQPAREAATDTLTGLLDRAAFELAMRRALHAGVPTGRRASLVLMDLDDLSWINHRHGQAIGDAAIRALADSLRTVCRATDVLARVGDDEFAAILLDVGARQAELVAQRVLHELCSRALGVERAVLRVSASAGVATAQATDSPGIWMERADHWLDRAKGLGKNRVLSEVSTAP
jgi:diguanylate cyclase (GGDEF)-like protein